MRRILAIAVFALLFPPATAPAWESYEFDLPAQTRESAWRDALAKELKGRTEVSIEGGRVDVLTDTWAIEVDWANKWHEGLGQALHYSDATGRQGVVALIAYGQGVGHLRENTRKTLERAERQCGKNGIKLIVLFPTLPRAVPQDPPPRPEDHWLNVLSGTRHNTECHFYGNTRQGRTCSESEGHACPRCGG